MKEESRKILDELIREHSCRYTRPSGLSDYEYMAFVKKLKKSYQRCINHLDKCCFKGE